MNTRPLRAAVLSAAALLTTLAAPCVLAQSQDYLTRANSPFNVIAASKRTDTELFPLLAKMDKAPASVSTPDKAALLPARSPDFKAAADWAQAAPQKAVLEALDKVTKESDWKKAYAIGQPYGAEGVSPEIIRTGLYTELGDPPILGAARHLYMPALDSVVCLANVEATRLAADGKPAEAVNVLINLAFLARQMCDRQFYAEIDWGFQQVSDAVERIRDVAYTDMKGARKYDLTAIPDQIKRLSEGDQGYLNLDRIKFPAGNRAAAEQLLARLYTDDGQVNQAVFAATMARMGSSEHPLRLFSVSAQYQDAARDQATSVATGQSISAIYNDFQRRWVMPYHDAGRGLITEYAKSNRARMAAVSTTTPDFNELIEQRMKARVELGGTRQALGLFAFSLNNSTIPAQITAVRPRWMSAIEIDLYNWESMISNSRTSLQYIVPRTTTADPAALAHQMEVFTDNGEANFKVALHNDTFILYSVGTDYKNNGAVRVQNTTKVVQGADYLFWPPVLSLYRQYLTDRGDIKITE